MLLLASKIDRVRPETVGPVVPARGLVRAAAALVAASGMTVRESVDERLEELDVAICGTSGALRTG